MTRLAADLTRKGGAGDGNRTHVSSLGSYSSTIELHPRPARRQNSRPRVRATTRTVPTLPKPSSVLVVMALPQESRGHLEAAGAALLYTGVGKINAAITVARRLAEIRISGAPPPLVVNLGTAGSRNFPPHTLVACNRFAQRDM